jgi:hypothetical protein
MSRAEVAQKSYLLRDSIHRGIYQGNPPLGFTVIYHSRHYLVKLWLAILGHEHGWSIRETKNEVIEQYRHIVMTCTCGEHIRVFVPPQVTFEGITALVNTKYQSNE